MNGKIVITLLVLVSAASLYGLFYYSHTQEKYVEITGGSYGEEYYGMKEKNKNKLVTFDLVDPESAPEKLVDRILYGYHIFLNTKDNAPEYAGNALCCNNCHFCAGNSLGGKNRGISLVGVSQTYPRFSKRDNKNITLADRLTNCFQRSLNGKAPPADGIHMKALIAYLTWISNETEDMPDLPWLGLPPVTSTHVADPKNGERLYVQHCQICHGQNGEGKEDVTKNIPPLWGDHSFNDGAGMCMPSMLSSFIWLNMPYGQPDLSPEEAMDVAAFVISKPRPKFKKG